MAGVRWTALRAPTVFEALGAQEIRRQPQDPRTMVRALVIGGCSPAEAGNLTAFSHGLRPTATGWTPAEIQHLLFLRSLVERGRIAH
jgi:hypothetical protein